MKFSLPNMISMFRVVTAPIIFSLLMSEQKEAIIIAAIVYHIAAFTDFLDGWIARKMNLVSNWGSFFDPLADKVLTISVFVAFTYLNIANFWMVLIIVLRDVFTTYMRVVADRMNEPLKTSKTAKTKTFLQMIYLSGLLIVMVIDSMNSGNSSIMAQLTHKNIPNIVLFFLTVLTVWSTIDYIIYNKAIFSQIIKEKSKQEIN